MRAAIALVVAAVVAFAGCGGSQPLTDQVPPSSETTSPGREAEEGTSGSSEVESAPGATVGFTIVDLAGRAGGDVAGIVTQEVDGLVVGGFASQIGDDPIVVGGDVQSTGYVGVCQPNAAAAEMRPESDEWDELPTAMEPVTGLDAGPSVGVTVTGVVDHAGHELAGVLYAGGELLDLDADALGGFWAVIDGNDSTTTHVIRTPSANLLGRFPFVSDEALIVQPGTYTLVLWVDHGLGGFERWVPVNSDGRGLYGCHHTFDVGTDLQTTIVVPADLQPDGWNVDCVTGAVTPGTDAAAAVAPPEFDQRGNVPAAMDPVTDLGAGPSVSVTVSGVSGRAGDEFAVVLYRGDDLSELDHEALGGFWAVLSSDDQSLTEVVRQPGDFGVGRFPYVSDAALAVEPGTYTLVLWVDEMLGPVSRWVPINTHVAGDPITEGMDLYGCHMVVEIGDDPVTDVVVPANLHHNGWNVDCVTGATIPGTDAAGAVNPDGSP